MKDKKKVVDKSGEGGIIQVGRKRGVTQLSSQMRKSEICYLIYQK